MKRTLLVFLSLSLILNLTAQVEKGLIAYYKMNGDASDASIFKNDGQKIGRVTPTIDRFGQPGQALQFDHKGYIKVPHNSALSTIRNLVTVTAWAKLTGDDYWFTLCCKSDQPFEDRGSPMFRFQITKVTAALSSEVVGKFVHDFAKDQWYFFAMTYNGKRLKVYVNNLLMTDTVVQYEMQSNSYPLTIGRDVPGRDEYFSGAIDDLRIYNRFLTEKEIVDIMNDVDKKPQIVASKDPIHINDTIRKTIVVYDTVQKTVNNVDTLKKTIVLQDTLRQRVIWNDTVRQKVIATDTVQRRIVLKDTVRKTIVLRDTLRRLITMNDTLRQKVILKDTVQHRIVQNDTVRETIVLRDTLRRSLVLNDTIRKKIVLMDTVLQRVVKFDTIRKEVVVNDTLRKTISIYDTVRKKVVEPGKKKEVSKLPETMEELRKLAKDEKHPIEERQRAINAYKSQLPRLFPRIRTIKEVEKPHRKITKVYINDNGIVNVYIKVKHDWGGVFYFIEDENLSYRNISQSIFKSRTRI